jgi:phage terminase large subunit
MNLYGNLKVSKLYTANLNATEDLIINQGGTSSGKTYSIMQVLFSIAISEPNRNILVVGQSIPNLKVGAMTDAESIIASSEELKTCIKSFNKTDRIYYFFSGSQIRFKSFKDAQDAKNGKRHYTFFNELNGISYPIFNEVAMMGRTTIRTWVDYNPNERFYIHQINDNPPEGTKVKFIRSWHEHNPYLSDYVRGKIEGIQDEELYKVYARGQTGKIEGLVFRNWSPAEELPKDAEYVATGIDFGYNDPCAIVSVYKYNEELWLVEELYKSQLITSDIVKYLDKENKYIFDSSRPDTAEELRRKGFKMEGSKKHLKSKNHKGSIALGIEILKNFKFNVIGQNLQKELMSYKWLVDKQTNEPTDEPVDFNNHAIDAVRYVALNKLKTNSRGNYTFM